jgi:alpha-L-fucosidase
MKVNGESIYGTTAGPFKTPLPWGRATMKGTRLYLHVFDWPATGTLSVSGFTERVTRAFLLGTPQTALSVRPIADGLQIKVPGTAPDPIATVIVLETAR